MIGSLIGAGVGAAASIFGAAAQNKAIKKVQKNLEAQKKQNEDWYNRRYNEDATQKADAQAMINKTQESIRERNKQAAAAQAVMGGTEEATAAAKAANNQAIADATAQIAAAGEQQKAQVENQYMTKKDAIQQQQNDMLLKKAENIAGAAQGVAQAASSIGGMF